MTCSKRGKKATLATALTIGMSSAVQPIVDIQPVMDIQPIMVEQPVSQGHILGGNEDPRRVLSKIKSGKIRAQYNVGRTQQEAASSSQHDEKEDFSYTRKAKNPNLLKQIVLSDDILSRIGSFLGNNEKGKTGFLARGAADKGAAARELMEVDGQARYTSIY